MPVNTFKPCAMPGSNPPSLDRKIDIAYFDPFNVFSELKQELENNLPLTNLHWNHSLRPLRSIAKLNVDFVEESANFSATPKHQMLGMSSAPYLKIFFFKCEDTEVYRSSVRSLIKDWLANNVNAMRDPTEWLIVYYIPPGSKAFLGNRFKYGVFDKLRIDFNAGLKKDKCLQLRADYLTDFERLEAWKEFVMRVKEGVLDAFSSRVDVYQEEITNLEARKHIMGWNYGKFFVLKEGLALAFEKMNLFEDALLLYDELEEAFSLISQQNTVTFFSAVGFESLPRPLLELQREGQMRHDILSNEISLFDYHCYLFSRQAHLLLCIAKASSSVSISALKVGELFLRLRSFLTEINSLLVSNKKVIQAIAEWTYSVVQEFQNATNWIDGGLAREVAEGRGELNLFLRKSLETIAATRNWVIEGVLTEVCLNDSDSDNIETDYKIQNEALALSLASPESFYIEYRTITERALAEFDLADRIRTKNRLSSQLALLDFQLKRYKEAASILENIPTLYNRQGWTIISSSLLLVYVECLKKLNRKEDVLINILELLSSSEHLSENQTSAYIDDVQNLSETVSFTSALDNTFNVSVDPTVEFVEGSNACYLRVSLRSSLKKPFMFDSATLTMRNLSDSTDILAFEISKNSLIVAPPGLTVFRLESNKFVQGKFKITALFFTKRLLTFTKSFTDSTPIIVNLYSSPKCFHAKLCIPPLVDLSDRRLGLCISTGVSAITSGQITLKGATPALRLGSLRSKSETNGMTVKVLEGKPPVISFGPWSSPTAFVISVPYVIDYDVTHIRLKAFFEYTGTCGKTFSYVIDQTLEISLALSVNVQDFYKWNKLFSKFSMSCNNGDEPVRILETQLASTDEYDISSPYGTTESHVSIFCCGLRIALII